MKRSPYLLINFSLLAAALLLYAGCGKGKQKVYRVGIVSGIDAFASTAESFKAKMTELGYTEGKDIVYDIQNLHEDAKGENRVVAKFAADKVDLIVSWPTRAALAAKAAGEKAGIPVIFANASVEGNNLVESMSRPGGNITGVRFPSSELAVKRLEFLHELAPRANRIYITWDKNYPGISFTVQALHRAAPSMNITLVEAPVSSLGDIRADLGSRDSPRGTGIDAVLIMPTMLTVSPEGFGVINDFASRHNLAVAGSTSDNAVRGAIFSYMPQNSDFGAPAALLADKILKGTPAGTIPVVSPESRLTINYKAIIKLGLKAGEGFLSMADEIIR